MIIKTNALVLYKNKGALVLEISGDKYTIRTISGERKNVRLKDIIFIHPGPCLNIPEAAVLPALDAQLETAELIAGDTMSFADFTELLFGSFTPAAALAAADLLAADHCFSGSPDGEIKANSREHINAVTERENQKNAQQAARAALLERIRSGAIEEADRTFLREIEFVAYGKSSSSKLMHDLAMEALPEKAQSLLLKLGVWNEFDHNPWPRRFEVDLTPEYPALPSEIPAEDRIDLTDLKAYAIDDSESNDPDDAISFDPAENLLWVHVADPASVITAGSALEGHARTLGCTLYLPEQITTMLPPGSVEMFGLGLQEISPALSFGMEITPDGEAILKKISASFIKVTRMDYTQAEELMQTPAFIPCVEAIERFRQYRMRNNAVMIKLPEVKVKVDIPQRSITIRDLERSPAREMVANAMMAAGHSVAKFAVEHDIILPFAVQNDPEITERPETIPGMYELRKSCRVSNLSTIPGKHAGLGLEPYVRVTSPLRRYEDLISHIQLRKYMKNEPQLTIPELDERICEAEPAAVLRGKLERQCREYWTLVYLKNQPEPWQGEGIFVAKPDERSVWLLPDLAFEFKNRYNARIALGESVLMQCTASDPAALQVQFKVIPRASAADTVDSGE